MLGIRLWLCVFFFGFMFRVDYGSFSGGRDIDFILGGLLGLFGTFIFKFGKEVLSLRVF